LSRDEALQHAETIAIFSARIAQRLACVSPHEQVRKFQLLKDPFSIEAGEMTPKLSLRRQPIMSRYAKEIESLYANEEVASPRSKVQR
jgi:long-chain acyl-CoA synthetase